MTAVEQEATVDMSILDGIKIIDADAHFTEPPDLWIGRVAESLQDQVPVQRTVDGITAWYLNDELWASLGSNTIGRDREKVLGLHINDTFDSIDPSAWSVKDRLNLMDDMGIYAQVIYPNGVGFSSNHMFAVEDLAQRTNLFQTYNDFYVDIQNESGRRLLPQAMLPIWDMDLCVQEMTRLLDQGISGFTLSDKPELLGLPELWESYFDPMWDIFNESRAVANFHIAAGFRKEDVETLRGGHNKQRMGAAEAGKPGTLSGVFPFWNTYGPQRRLAVTATQMYMSNVRIIVNLCMSNLFDRFPNLKIVSAESGIGWVPFLLEALEYQYDEMVTSTDELTFAQRRPREYFREHMYVMFWFEESGPAKLIEDIGSRNVLVETDVPHSTCLYPGAREHFAKVLAGASPETLRRVLQDNAAELYNIPLG